MREILQKLAEGKMSVDEAERALKFNAIETIPDVARLDVGRKLGAAYQR